jgi:peptidylprolyl isomerase
MLLRRLPKRTPRLRVLCAAGATVLCAIRPASIGASSAALLNSAAAYPDRVNFGLLQTRLSSSNVSQNVASPRMVVAEGKRVAIHYTGTLSGGLVFDSTEGKSPLEFDVGSGDTLKGIDAAVRGMTVGESKTLTLTPADAYGEYDPSKLQEVEISRLPEGCEVGTPLQAGQQRKYVVTAIKDGVATLDGNHELAGKTLAFDIRVTAITDPPEPFRSKRSQHYSCTAPFCCLTIWV